MTFGLREHLVQAIVLDIEGTTTPIAFVYDVLFPFARAHLGDYLRAHQNTNELREPVSRLRDEWSDDVARGESAPDWPSSRVRLKPDTTVDFAKPDTGDSEIASVAAYVEWLMDRDRKSP